MTLHFHWLHAHAQVGRAMTLVLGVIGISLLFSALKVLDVAVSGALIENHAVAAAASATPATPDVLIGSEPTAASAAAFDTTFDVPQATAEAVSL